MDINALSQTASVRTPVANKLPTPAEVTKDFTSFLTDALNQVNQAQVESANLADRFAAGEITDLHQVTVAGQKASVMLQMTLQVRNKMIESYQEIMRMQI
ncbi:flagellar hook-basal body complex protein FliE [Brevibacillus gelatini]|jgi:flagellar hook-basal body complex protein FliE|uniref:Flagellar hook-basal body complex protein FliE n=1 Tax=Brevibacillus gelatini TaxID=1655277 RepID=A0A3M8B8S5_9BACL|nr:flagellar hook-basal body complex protein FliE [Brevibacillus gelatini]RNB59702.1 flagellar hook-basal body complex protein FliE [Brevibacillus gelatini]